VTSAADPLWFLREGGVTGQTAREVDWKATALGAPEGWPATLKTTLATMFCARQPMFLWWGPELIQFYNDAYLPSFGRGKHPRAMGQRGRECWHEIWPIIGPQIDDVMERARSSFNEDALVPIFRNGKIEEVYWTYTYSPVFGEDGAVAGTLVISTETTNRVLGERRSNLLHALVGETSVASDRATLMAKVLEVIDRAPADIPFAAFVERASGAAALTPAATVGLAPHAVTSLVAQLDVAIPGVLGREPWLMPLLEVAPGPGEAHGEVFISPLSLTKGEAQSFLVFGVSPQLSFDDGYRRFLEQVKGHLLVATTRVDEALRRTAVELERRNLLEQAPVATALMVGPDHVFELANPAYRQMVARPDIVGKTYIEVFPELAGTPLPGILDRVYETGEPFVTSEIRVPIARGAGPDQDSFFTFNLEPIRNATGAVYAMMAVAVDITHQVRARQALEKAQVEREGLLRELESASRAKDEFLAMLGHELRNPLSPIVTALHLMRLKTDDRALHEQAIIERQVNHLVRLVDDLLDVAKIARGQVQLRRETVDVMEVVGKAIEMASDLLERRHHRLKLTGDRGRFFCNADPVRLAQVVANLLTNSAKYTNPHGRVSVRVSGTDDEIAISVTDDGIGMSPEMLPRVFTLFEQPHRTSDGADGADRARGGLGIGLALVKNLVALHGGSVSAQSDGPGQGSTFTVRLPATRGAPARDAERPAAAPHAPHAKRILVVDDNVDAAEILAESLVLAGHRVEVAIEPLGALEIAARFSPEIAVLDIGLPVIDGYELARRLRAVPGCESCRMIALTGYGQEHDRQRSRDAGFHRHLVKPFDVDRLIALVADSG
jgi:signal transduction histidine kinase